MSAPTPPIIQPQVPIIKRRFAMDQFILVRYTATMILITVTAAEGKLAR